MGEKKSIYLGKFLVASLHKNMVNRALRTWDIYENLHVHVCKIKTKLARFDQGGT